MGPVRHSSPHSSFQRKLECGFTFEVQQVGLECLGGGMEVEALSGRIVVGVGGALDLFGGKIVEVDLARQVFSQASDGVLDAAFLPWAVGVAEVGPGADLVEALVPGELAAIVEADGCAQRRG